jgi:hypothetical protein
MFPQYLAYLFEVINDALPSQHELLDLLNRWIKLILHASKILGYEGVFVLSSNCVEIIIFVLVLALEDVSQRIEGFGFFRRFGKSVPPLNFFLPKALEGINLFRLLTFIPDFPKIFSRQLLIVPSWLYYFWHQQWNNYNGNLL